MSIEYFFLPTQTQVNFHCVGQGGSRGLVLNGSTLPWLQGKTALQAPAFLQLLPQPRTRTPKPGKHAQSSHTHFQNQSDVFNWLSEGWFYTHTHSHTRTHALYERAIHFYLGRSHIPWPMCIQRQFKLSADWM